MRKEKIAEERQEKKVTRGAAELQTLTTTPRPNMLAQHAKNGSNHTIPSQIKRDVHNADMHTRSNPVAWMELHALTPSFFCSDFVDQIFSMKGSFYADHAMRKCVNEKGSCLVASTRCGCRNCENLWVETCEIMK